jgi:ubiquinone/menaquinone biosynthesis C-methylase UbiE
MTIESMRDESGFQMGDDTIPDRYDLHMWRFMEPHVNALIDAAAVSPGEAVLDVACGTGFVARTAVDRGAAPVVGADVNPAMLATARRRSDNVTWVEASALDMPFDDDEFDVAICSQGVQFFPEPVVGLREMARVASRLAVTVWSARSEVPWFDAHIPMLTEVCGVDPALMDLSFNQEKHVRDWFIDAGLRPEINALETSATLPTDFSSSYLSALPWGQPFFGLDADDRHAALTRIGERLTAYKLASGDMAIPFRAFLVTAETD